MKRLFALTFAVLFLLPFAASANSTPWQFVQTQDDFSDEALYAAMTKSTRGAEAGVFCGHGQLKVWVKTTYLDMRVGDTRFARYRVDDQPPVDEVWLPASKNGMFLSGEPAVALAKAIRNARDRFVIQNEVATARFGVTNSTATVSKVLSACGMG